MKEIDFSQIWKNYVNEVLIDLLPNQRVASLSSFNGNIHNMKIAEQNSCYKESIYYDNPSQNTFIHFTSLNSLYEILSTNKLRLYDLNYSNDPREFSFQFEKNIDYKQFNIKSLKSKLYSLSLCSYPLNEKYEYNMWRIYGNDGTGVGIVFTFQNNFEEWNSYNFSKIHYHENDKIPNSIIKHNDFFKKLNLETGSNHSNDSKLLVENILSLFAFHKENIYSLENEYRLLFKKQELDDSDIFYTTNKKGEVSSYKVLNLFSEQFISGNYTPLLKIGKIILGYQYSETFAVKLRGSFFDQYALNSTLFRRQVPIIEITTLKEKYSL